MAFRNRAAVLAVILLAFVLFTISAIAGTEGAAAARYVVAQCGWHVGHDADWHDGSNGLYSRSTYCQTPASADAFDGVHMNSQVKSSVNKVGGTRTANWRWQAPAGALIVTVRGQRWQYVRDGFQHRLGGVPPNGSFTPFLALDTNDGTKREFTKGFSPWMKAFVSRLVCLRSADKSCGSSGTVLTGIRALTITLDDPARPTTQITGALTGAGWLRGTQALTFSSTDSGAGLRFAETSIAGSVRSRTEMNCGKVSVAGQWRGTRMQPCPTAASGSHSVDTRGLPDGPHLLRHCALDFAGNSGCAADRTIRVDNNPPAAPRALRVEGGEEWHRENGFKLTWENPAQGAGSPVATSHYRLSGPDGYTGGPWRGTGPDRIDGIQVPGPGEYRVRVWLGDQAGNVDPSHAAEATLRLDNVAPTGYFLDPPEDDPELIRVPVSDRFSGVAGGSIAWRSASGNKWEEIPARFHSQDDQQLVARFPAGMPRGTWVLRATIADRAGNLTVTDRRANGSLMTMKTPLKDETRLVAGFSRDVREARRSTQVGYGQRTHLAGRLTATESGGVSGVEVTVEERPRAGGKGGLVSHRARTDARGYFDLWLAAGPGRQVSVSFPGTKRLEGSTSGVLDLRVRGKLTFKAKPKRLRTGRKVFFRGRVLARGAWHPLKGNVVQIQYFERSARRWRPVVVTRTDRRGHYRTGYRFRYITGKARIRLRAVLVPASRFPYAGSASRQVGVRVRG